MNTIDVLEPVGDEFRNYIGRETHCTPETRLLDQANLLELTAPQMTVLVGGMRALNANHGQSKHGVFTDRPGTLTNDFFVDLVDVGAAWRPSVSAENATRESIAPRATSSGPRLRPTSSSVRTSSSGRWRRSTQVTTRRRSSCVIS